MAQNVIYWKFDTDTLYIRGDNLDGYTTWNSPGQQTGDPPWNNYAPIITSVVIETPIDVTAMYFWFRYTKIVSIVNSNYETIINLSDYINNVTTMSGCFQNCTNFDQSIIIPNSVNYMSGCFAGCTSFDSTVTFQDTSKVISMNSCFKGCTSFNQPIVIPSSITIMDSCFRDCTSFDSTVTFQDTSKVISMNNCFKGCTNFNQSITIPSSVINMESCFSGCTNFNQPITIPSSVTNMYSCFNGCTNFDQSIIIPNRVTNMNYCFSGCTNFDSTVTFQTTSKVTNMYNCFMGCTSFDKSITIPNSVINMSDCFRGCTSFDKPVTIPNSVLDMSNCFSGCTAFNSAVTFQTTSKVTNMYACFRGCTKFDQSVTIPNSVYDMGSCFSGCTNFDSTVNFQTTSKVNSMGFCFFNCTSFDKPVTIPNSVLDMSNCFSGCTALKSTITIQVTSRITNMYGCFAGCTNFDKSVTIPNSVYDMGSCFSGCTNFDKPVTIPNNVTNMNYCFSGCTNFDSTVTFQTTSKVTNMYACFRGCAKFDQSVTIPNSVTNIHSCFSGCTNFDSAVNFQATSKVANMYCCFFGCKKFNQSIIIPNSVTNMGECFSGCTDFDKPITIPNNVTNMNYCFSGCTNFDSTVTFQTTSKVTNMYACFRGCAKFDQSVTIPNSVTNIHSCFSGCTNFNQSITIPNSVNAIDSCFRNCKNLNNVIIINKTNQAISYINMFLGTEKLIVLDRSSTISIESLQQLADTSNNSNVKVNNLAILASSATRNTENSSQIDIVVEVSDSYSHNIDIDICGSPSTSSSRADVLWYNNPEYVGNPLSELEIDGSNDSTTFYGLIEDIDTDNSLSLFVICHYSLIETSFQELRIGSSYYTMDFLAGGKEIAIGVGASPDDIYSEVEETYNIPFTNEMFKTSDTTVDINKAYYDYNQEREPKYQLVNLSQYEEEVLDSINPSESNTTYNTPWYDVFQETEFYQRINRTEYERLNTKPQNWMDISSYTQIASEVTTGFEYAISEFSGKWKIEIGIQLFDDTSEQIYWNAGIFDYGISKTYRSVKLVEVLGETYRITIGYNSQDNKIIMSRIGDFSHKVNYYMRTKPLYFTLSSTRGIFKCGMDAIFRSKQAPEVFKSMYDLMYPVGSVYTTNTYINPKSWLGGNWSLIDKKFASRWRTLSPSWTSYTKTDRALYGKYIGNSIELRTNWTTNTALSDVSRNIFSIPWSTLGLTALDHAVYLQANADGANAVGIGIFTNYTYYDANGNAGTTDKTKGSLIIHDWITRATSYPTSTGYSVASSFIITVSPSIMVNSFCDQFIWKRIS